jgi:hypothetical protein
MDDEKIEIAEIVRSKCIEAAREGFRDASISGLCIDGAIEAAISAIQSLDLAKITESQK